MQWDFDLGRRMYLAVEEDTYGKKHLFACAKHGTYHPIVFEHQHLRLLLSVMDMALAANPRVNPLEDRGGDRDPLNLDLSHILRQEHEVIRETIKKLDDLEYQRRHSHKSHREHQARSRAEQEREREREAERQAELAQWQADREQWERDRAEWEHERARWQAADESAGTD